MPVAQLDLKSNKVMSRNAKRQDHNKLRHSQSKREGESSKFSLFEETNSLEEGSAQKFEFEKRMLLQLELR